jgi:hypothetical protein
MVGSQSGYLSDPGNPESRFVNQDTDIELSLGGKYALTSDLTTEAAYNPDFSQIEADASQIDVNSTIALLYPERRPFFQEGSDIFRTIFNSFYTRTVNDPQFAAKLTGRIDRNSVGLMTAYDENTPYVIPLEERSIIVNTGKSSVNVLRATKSFAENNQLGFIVTDRRFDGGGYGSIVALDGDIRLSARYDVIGQLIMSYTREPNDSLLSAGLEGISFDNGKRTASLDGEYFSGSALIAQFRRRARNWNFTVNYDEVDPSYRTETGYDPWNDYRNLNVFTTYNIFPAKGLMEQVSPELFFENRWNYDDEKKWTHYGISVNHNLRMAQTYFGAGYQRGAEQWGGVDFKNLWNAEFFGGARPRRNFGFEFNVGYGPNVARWLLTKGNEFSFYAGVEYKPIDRFIIEPTVNYLKSTQTGSGETLFRQFIGRTRFQLQASRQFSMRLVAQYNDFSDSWDFDPLITYRLSPFSMFYAGSTHDITQLTSATDGQKFWEQTSRQFFMKLQYLFRI